MHAMTKPQSVPFLDLSPEFDALEAEWLEAVRHIGHSGAFILGPNVTAFEQEAAAHIGAAHAIAVANGTDALVLSLRAFDVGPGDEVITTPFTFFATAEAITLVGATPVFADIDPRTYCLDAADVRARVTSRTKAIIPVHLYGHPAPMDALQALAREKKLVVIEDCAQAFGARVQDRRVGSLGDTGCFSFYPTKVLGCYGDGGLITTSSKDVAERLRRLRNHGAAQPFMHAEIGYNSRLDEIQAALLRIKLRHVDAAIEARRRVAKAYDDALRDSGAALPAAARGEHVFNLYTVRVPRRDAVRERLTRARIASSVCYPRPLHLQEVYRTLGYQPGALPHSERAATEVLSLPIYPGMSDAQIDYMAETLTAALRG